MSKQVYGWILTGEEDREVKLNILNAGLWEESRPDTYRFTNTTFRSQNEARVALVFRLNELIHQAQELQIKVLSNVLETYDEVWHGCGI